MNSMTQTKSRSKSPLRRYQKCRQFGHNQTLDRICTTASCFKNCLLCVKCQQASHKGNDHLVVDIEYFKKFYLQALSRNKGKQQKSDIQFLLKLRQSKVNVQQKIKQLQSESKKRIQLLRRSVKYQYDVLIQSYDPLTYTEQARDFYDDNYFKRIWVNILKIDALKRNKIRCFADIAPVQKDYNKIIDSEIKKIKQFCNKQTPISFLVHPRMPSVQQTVKAPNQPKNLSEQDRKLEEINDAFKKIEITKNISKDNEKKSEVKFTDRTFSALFKIDKKPQKKIIKTDQTNLNSKKKETDRDLNKNIISKAISEDQNNKKQQLQERKQRILKKRKQRKMSVSSSSSSSSSSSDSSSLSGLHSIDSKDQFKTLPHLITTERITKIQDNKIKHPRKKGRSRDKNKHKKQNQSLKKELEKWWKIDKDDEREPQLNHKGGMLKSMSETNLTRQKDIQKNRLRRAAGNQQEKQKLSAPKVEEVPLVKKEDSHYD